MPISATDFLKKHGYDEEEKQDHSLQHNAKEHAKHLKSPMPERLMTGKIGSDISWSIRMRWKTTTQMGNRHF